jgi:formylglycine-generating enzyme required for sulfatase activity
MVPVETGLCVDRYEYPNRAGEVPRALVSWIEAQALCKKSGKRLCTFAEWQLACGGPGHWKYPYGNTFRKGTCRDGLDRFTAGPAASGSLGSCVSAYGAFDMTGNLSEWVADDAGEGFKTFVGGSFASDPQEASCTASLGNLSDSKSRHIGFRCCVDLTAPQK